MALPRTYRALQLAAPGPVSNFKMVERALAALPLKALGAEPTVVVKVAACAVAYRDVLDRQGAFKFIKSPTVLGHEFAGEVVATNALQPPSPVTINTTSNGETDPARRFPTLAVGDRVCSLHWAQTEAWPSPLTAKGAVSSMFGLNCDGGYAEYVVARASAFVRPPPHVTAAEASCLVSTFGTVWCGAIERAGLKPGHRVLVTGASGGVGSAAVLIAKAYGCAVTAVTTSEAKAPFLRDVLKADDIVVADREGAFRLPKGAAPADVVVEAVGGPTFASSLRATAPGGKLVLVGNVNNATVSLPLGYCILNSVSVVGSDSILARSFETHLAPFLEEHALRPTVAKVVPLADAPAAHEALESRAVTGRVVLDVNGRGGEW